MMMGTPGALVPQEPVEKPKFIEDMAEHEVNLAHRIPPGLENLGNTCYMNATVQCLHAVPELSQALVKSQQSIPTFSNDPEKNLTVSMRDLFRNLNNSGTTVNPLVFLQSMRARYPQFSQQERGMFMQQDAEECFSALVSNLEHTVMTDASSSSNSFVKKYMTGLVEQTMTCDEAPQEPASTAVDKMYRLNCHISQQVNFLQQGVQESLKEHIEKTSPTLNRTAKYTRSSKIIRLPKYLTVCFVRFFWKQEVRTKAKIMRAVKFPLDLDVNEFCAASLQEKMKPARDLLQNQLREKQEQKKRQKTAATNVEKPTASPSGQKDFKTILKEQGMDADLLNEDGANIHGFYELTAVLTHVGRSADSGHYMAWVRDEETAPQEKTGHHWWKFDDDKVTAVTEEDILKLNGGGDWHMAYMLLYKAKQLE